MRVHKLNNVTTALKLLEQNRVSQGTSPLLNFLHHFTPERKVHVTIRIKVRSLETYNPPLPKPQILALVSVIFVLGLGWVGGQQIPTVLYRSM